MVNSLTLFWAIQSDFDWNRIWKLSQIHRKKYFTIFFSDFETSASLIFFQKYLFPMFELQQYLSVAWRYSCMAGRTFTANHLLWPFIFENQLFKFLKSTFQLFEPAFQLFRIISPFWIIFSAFRIVEHNYYLMVHVLWRVTQFVKAFSLSRT